MFEQGYLKKEDYDKEAVPMKVDRLFTIGKPVAKRTWNGIFIESASPSSNS